MLLSVPQMGFKWSQHAQPRVLLAAKGTRRVHDRIDGCLRHRSPEAGLGQVPRAHRGVVVKEAVNWGRLRSPRARYDRPQAVWRQGFAAEKLAVSYGKETSIGVQICPPVLPHLRFVLPHLRMLLSLHGCSPGCRPGCVSAGQSRDRRPVPHSLRPVPHSLEARSPCCMGFRTPRRLDRPLRKARPSSGAAMASPQSPAAGGTGRRPATCRPTASKEVVVPPTRCSRSGSKRNK